MRALIIAEVIDAKLKSSVASLVNAGVKVAGVVDVYLMGNGEAAQAEAAKLAGVESVFVNPDSGENLMTESVTNAVLSRAEGYTHIFFDAGTFGKSIMPRVAVKLDVQPMSDVIDVIDHETFVRPIYAGSIEVTLKNDQTYKVATIRSTAFEPVELTGNAQLQAAEAMAEPMKTRKVSFEAVKSDRPALQSARIVVAGGRGLSDEDGFKALEELADQLGAAVGATRAVVDLGLCPNDWQVGQTGKVIAPDLYVAFGISGAMQHLSGIKDAKTVVAINIDPEAPIFEVADYGLVMDAKEGIAALKAALQ